MSWDMYPDSFIQYFLNEGPYCPSCKTFLGPDYNEGDLCLECWEVKEEIEPHYQPGEEPDED